MSGTSGHTNLNKYFRFKGHKLRKSDYDKLKDVQPVIKYYRLEGRMAATFGYQGFYQFGGLTRDILRTFVSSAITDSAIHYENEIMYLENNYVGMFTNNSTATACIKIDALITIKSTSQNPSDLLSYGADNLSGGSTTDPNLWFESFHDSKTLWKNYKKVGKSQKFYLGPGETFKVYVRSNPNKKLSFGYFAYSSEVNLKGLAEHLLFTITGGQVASITNAVGTHLNSTVAACNIDWVFERRVVVKEFPVSSNHSALVTFDGSIPVTKGLTDTIKIVTEDTDDVEDQAVAGA